MGPLLESHFETTVAWAFVRYVDMQEAAVKPPIPNDPSANRRTPRRSYERLVGVLYHGEYILLRSNQISEGGMRLELPEKIQVGDLIVVTFILPVTLEPVVGRAEIVHRKVEGMKKGYIQMGIKFVHLDTFKRRVIRDFVSSKPPDDKGLKKKKALF